MATFYNFKREVEKFLKDKNIRFYELIEERERSVYCLTDEKLDIYMQLECDEPNPMQMAVISMSCSLTGQHNYIVEVRWNSNLGTPYEDSINEFLKKREDVARKYALMIDELKAICDVYGFKHYDVIKNID